MKMKLSEAQVKFISYYPLKQGLKPRVFSMQYEAWKIYILLSIKTRIETTNLRLALLVSLLFISYYPLKQGLKPEEPERLTFPEEDLYPTIH